MRELWMKRHLAVMDCFTIDSRFMFEPYVTWGLERSRMRHVTNGQRNYGAGRKDDAVRTLRNRFGFFGQRVDNKGIWLLLQAAQLLRAEGFEDFVLEINGGNLIHASEAHRNEIEAVLAAELERPLASRNISMNGAYHMADLPARMGRVDWRGVPSTWWEIFGRPVIATDTVGPRERIRHFGASAPTHHTLPSGKALCGGHRVAGRSTRIAALGFCKAMGIVTRQVFVARSSLAGQFPQSGFRARSLVAATRHLKAMTPALCRSLDGQAQSRPPHP